jgi:hypothetical protein
VPFGHVTRHGVAIKSHLDVLPQLPAQQSRSHCAEKQSYFGTANTMQETCDLPDVQAGNFSGVYWYSVAMVRLGQAAEWKYATWAEPTSADMRLSWRVL